MTVKHLVVLSLLGTIMFAAKMATAALPNIEPVSLLVMVCAVVCGSLAFYPICTYVVLEILMWGINLWTINYLYIWAALALFAWLLRKYDSAPVWAILSGAFGLTFGALCTPVYLVTGGGWQFALTWWISGIPFDVVHCVANFAIALVLFKPCRKVLTILSRQTGLL